MKIAIIGSGNVGAALANNWLKAGHNVIFGVRNPDSPKTRKALALIPNAVIQNINSAVSASEVIVIATPSDAALDLVPLLGNPSGKIIIDTTNSIMKRPEPYPTAYHALKDILKHEEIVKCFNSTGFENMLNPIYKLSLPGNPEIGIDMFAAGNSRAAKEAASQLSKDCGFAECFDFGGDDKVELLEKFALSWINLAIMQGHGRNLAFKLIKRTE
ncbi:MAG: NAD(P)-binding domain-containing protein [Ignavibacteriaceae bacterium]|nr:NAD(P)-binding domain-containing protein [Ignavibacteriaceae bacterium]